MSSETGFWNFRFKLILLIALLMAGTLSVQAVIRNHSIQVILDGTEEVAAEIANEAAEKMLLTTIPMVALMFVAVSASAETEALVKEIDSSLRVLRLQTGFYIRAPPN